MDCLILLFGASGDLSKRKLIPSLYQLLLRGKLGRTQIVGAGFEDLAKSEVLEAARPFICDFTPDDWRKLVDCFHYLRVDIASAQDFAALAKLVSELRRNLNLPHKTLIYCAVYEELYSTLTSQLADVNILERCNDSEARWCRIVYEKPFGHNFASVAELNRQILHYVNEDQIYRIDHYLAKPVVEDLISLRFANTIFETLWGHNQIESVQIVLDESLQVGDRAKYYDKYGVIKDVVQNHILQLIALVGMDRPRSLNVVDIAAAKVAVLEKLRCLGGFLGQYLGYQGEAGVPKTSQTPTFAVLQFEIATERWQGVPFYIRTGRALADKLTKISIKFKGYEDLHFNGQKIRPDSIDFCLYPEARVELVAEAAKPATTKFCRQVMPLQIQSDSISRTELADYAYILNAILHGSAKFAVRTAEIEAAWRVSDQIEALSLPIYDYPPGTHGPSILADFNSEYKLDW